MTLRGVLASRQFFNCLFYKVFFCAWVRELEKYTDYSSNYLTKINGSQYIAEQLLEPSD